ncbi:ATPase [bacterium]|nr:ATPase [bacterium]
MKNNLTTTISISINASSSKVWEALTTPALIKQYFFGTDTISDWKIGSPISFKGMWEGKEYLDKGMILESVPEKLFKYTYLSSFSGLEDKIENYSNITYSLATEATGTKITVTQDNIETEEKVSHSIQGWEIVLNGLKKLLEQNI